MASRSRGTPAAISEGTATPPGTRGAAPRPAPPAPSGHSPVRPAYASATTPTASRRAASSASASSWPARTAAVSRPRSRMSPSEVRRTSSGVRSRWCIPRWRADSRAEATSPVIRRTSSPGTPPSMTSDPRVRESPRSSSTTYATSSSVPTSRMRTKTTWVTDAARRAASRITGVRWSSAAMQRMDTLRPSVVSSADHRSTPCSCSRRRWTVYRPPRTVPGPTPLTAAPFDRPSRRAGAPAPAAERVCAHRRHCRLSAARVDASPARGRRPPRRRPGQSPPTRSRRAGPGPRPRGRARPRPAPRCRASPRDRGTPRG